jgi:hypothetical protein
MKVPVRRIAAAGGFVPLLVNAAHAAEPHAVSSAGFAGA